MTAAEGAVTGIRSPPKFTKRSWTRTKNLVDDSELILFPKTGTNEKNNVDMLYIYIYIETIYIERETIYIYIYTYDTIWYDMIYVSMLDYHLACLKKSSPSAARSSSGAELILRSATLEAQFCPHGHGMPWLRVYHAIPCYTTFSEKQICLEHLGASWSILEHLGASWFMPLLVLMPKKRRLFSRNSST